MSARALEWGTACGRHYVAVWGVVVAVEGDACRDPGWRGRMGSDVWTADGLRDLVRGERRCGGKRILTKQEAQARAEHVREHGKLAGSWSCVSYKCHKCGQHHCGRDPREARRRGHLPPHERSAR